jgi:endonuclease III
MAKSGYSREDGARAPGPLEPPSLLGLLPLREHAQPAHHLLARLLEDTYAMHVDMIRHGRQICRAQRPRCTQCPLRDLCLYRSGIA